ncbi:MAG: ferrous iron transport protein A [Phycisphaeraceae bacterium]
MPVADASDSGRLLSQLKPGELAVITHVAGEGPQAMRIKQLGLCQGRCVQLLRDRDPLILQVLGTRLGLARSLADSVYVAPCEQ